MKDYEFGYYAFQTLPKAKSNTVGKILASVDGIDVCESNIMYDNSEHWEFSGKLPLSNDKFANLQENYSKVCALKEKVADGLYSHFYFIHKGILYRSVIDNSHKFRAAVVSEELIGTVLYLGHNQSGHNGYQRTYAATNHMYYLKGMRKHVLVHCQNCVTCAKQKVQRTQFEKQIFEPGVQPTEFICIDVIGEFHPPSSKGNRYTLAAVCMPTDYTFCIPSRTNQQKKSSQPGEIIFLSHLVSAESYCLTMGQNLKMIYSHRLQSSWQSRERSTLPPTRPQSNGHIEGFHKFLKACLSKHISRHREWDDVTPLATASYNWLPNQHSKESPFFM